MACDLEQNIRNKFIDRDITNDNDVILNIEEAQNLVNTINNHNIIDTEKGITLNSKLVEIINDNNTSNSIISYNSDVIEAVYTSSIYNNDNNSINKNIDKSDKPVIQETADLEISDELGLSNDDIPAGPVYFDMYVKFTKKNINRIRYKAQILSHQINNHKPEYGKIEDLIARREELNISASVMQAALTRLIDSDGNINIDELLAFYVNNDLNRARRLAGKQDFASVKESEEILTFIMRLSDISSRERHPFFNPNDIIKLPKATKDVLNTVSRKAAEIYTYVSNKKYVMMTKVINDIAKQKGLDTDNNRDGFTITKEQIDESVNKETMLSFFDAYLSDITTGIFTTNGVIPQVMEEYFNNVMTKHLSNHLKLNERITKIEKKLRSAINKLPSNLRKRGYNVFMTYDKNGLIKNTIISQHSWEYKKQFDDMYTAFREVLNYAENMAEGDKKTQAVASAFAFRNKWIKDNNIVLDVTKLGAVAEAVPELADQITHDEAYVQSLKNTYGELEYNNMVSEQIKKAQEFIKVLSHKADAGMDVEFGNTHSPVAVIKTFNSLTENGYDRYDNIKFITSYSVIVPRETDAEGNPTNYFDSTYELLAKNPVLKEFHDIMVEVQSLISSSLPLSKRRQFMKGGLPKISINVSDIFFDKNYSFFERFKHANNYAKDFVSNTFLNKKPSYTNLRYDPFLNRTTDRVNDKQFEGHERTISNRFKIEAKNINVLLGLDIDADISNNLTVDAAENPAIIGFIADLLGVSHNAKHILRIFPDLDLNSIPIKSIVTDIITNQVLSEGSFNIPKIIKSYSQFINEYNARQEMLPMMQSLRDHYENVSRNNNRDSEGRDHSKLEESRELALKHMRFHFQKNILGISDFQDEKIRKIITKASEDTKKGEDDTFRGFMLLSGHSAADKAMKSRIDRTIKRLENGLKDDSLTEEQKSTINETIQKLKQHKNNLRRFVTAHSTLRSLLNATRFTFIALNAYSYMKNLMHGNLSLLINGVRYFKNERNLLDAMVLARQSYLYINRTFATPTARKISILMERYDILQESSNPLQQAHKGTRAFEAPILDPYYGQKKTEFLIQAPIMIAALKEAPITDINGNASNVWKALNSKGMLKPMFRTAHNIKAWEEIGNDDYTNFKSFTSRVIIYTQGDYRKNGGIMLYKFDAGRLVGTFKKFYFKLLESLFGIEQKDIGLKMKVKGRLRSLDPTTGSIMGALLGSSLNGWTGAAVGFSAGLFVGNKWGVKGEIGMIRQLLFTTKVMILNQMKLVNYGVSIFTGLPIIKGANFDKHYKGKISDLDVRNMKANMMQISTQLMTVALVFMAKNMFWDDDDDKNDPDRRLHNILVNTLNTIIEEISIYTDPVESTKMLFQSIAPISLLERIGVFLSDVVDYFKGDIYTAQGERKIDKSSSKLIPSIFRESFGFEGPLSKVYNDHELMNESLSSEETKAKDKLVQMKGEIKYKTGYRKLTDDDPRKGAVKDVIGKFRKRKHETYADVVKRMERIHEKILKDVIKKVETLDNKK